MKKLEAERVRVFEEVKDITFDEPVSQDQVIKPNLSQINQNAKIDFSQVRPFVAKPEKLKINTNSS
jgi:hypothetical protein